MLEVPDCVSRRYVSTSRSKLREPEGYVVADDFVSWKTLSAQVVVDERTGVLNRGWPPAILVRPGVRGVRPGVVG